MKRKFVFLIFTYLVLASCTNAQVNTRERQIRFSKYEKFVCLGRKTPSTNLNCTLSNKSAQLELQLSLWF